RALAQSAHRSITPLRGSVYDATNPQTNAAVSSNGIVRPTPPVRVVAPTTSTKPATTSARLRHAPSRGPVPHAVQNPVRDDRRYPVARAGDRRERRDLLQPSAAGRRT